MRRLLILTDLFPPSFAPRIAFFAEHIRAHGWMPIVFTEEYEADSTFADYIPLCPVYRFQLRHRTGWAGKMEQIGELCFQQKEKLFTQNILKTLELERLDKPDLIICFAYRKFPLRSAHQLAKRWQIPWIADCRDLIEQYSGTDFLPSPLRWGKIRLGWLEKLLGKYYIRQRNRLLSSSSAVVTVSPFHQQVLRRVHPRVELIYNGFDPLRFRPSYPSTSTFRIVFTGRILSLGMRNPQLLIEALQSPPLRYLPLELAFYTDTPSRELIQSLPIAQGEDRIRYYDMVPNAQIPALLASASIILLLSNQEQGNGPRGMVSTKVFEAIAMQKPTLLIPGINTSAGEILHEARCGIATNKVATIIHFILQQYQDWSRNGFTASSHADTHYIAQFSRLRQVRQFAQLMNSIVPNPQDS